MSFPRIFSPFARWTSSFAFQRVSLREIIVGRVKNTVQSIKSIHVHEKMSKASNWFYLWRAEHGLNSPSNGGLLDKIRAWRSN